MSREDDIEEMVRRQEEEDIANAANNAWEYVGARFRDSHARGGNRVRVSPTVKLASTGPFYPVTHGGEVNIQPGPNGQGIDVQLEDRSTGEIGDYRMESDGNNGVHITRYFGPVRR